MMTELDLRYPKELRIECPCCDGHGKLEIHEGQGPIYVQCNHCMGLGFVLKDNKS